MADQFLAEIRIFGCNFAPNGWAQCNGQILSISQNTALFSLLGTNYGGDGRSTFALPNLQGAATINAGQGPSLSTYIVGESGGQATVALTSAQMPTHTHPASAVLHGTKGDPNGLIWGNPPGRPAPNFFANAIGTAPSLNPLAVTSAGGGNAHNNLMPYTVLNFCIALQGIFPPRG